MWKLDGFVIMLKEVTRRDGMREPCWTNHQALDVLLVPIKSVQVASVLENSTSILDL